MIKHAEPTQDQSRDACDWQLSARGRAKSVELAKALVHYAPSVIYASHEPKAHETATIVADHLDIALHTHPNLNEHDRRDVGYLPKAEFEAKVKVFFRYPKKHIFGNESADETHTRFAIAINTLLARHTHETIAVVTHGTVISLFVSRVCTGINGFELWQKLGLPSFVVLSWQPVQIVNLVATIT